MDDGPPSICVATAEAEVDLRDPSVALAHPNEGIRRLALEGDVSWMDGTPERRRAIATAIVGERDVIPRMAAFERAREASLIWRLQKIAACVRDRTAMDWSLLEPPSPDSVRNHLRLDPWRDGVPWAEASGVAASRVMEELPVEFAAARFAGLIVPLPDTLLGGLARWLEAEPAQAAERFETFSSTPLRARLAARALVLHGLGSIGAGGRCLALLAEALKDGSALFCAVLRWVVRETARRGDWRTLIAEERAALAWTYADLLAATLLAADVDRAGTAQVFEGRSNPTPRDLVWKAKRSESFAERGERLSARALAGLILGDVLAEVRPDSGPSGEERGRLRELCANPSGPYAALELFGLGRAGWTWLDADPLPILSRHLDAFGPENLTGLDRPGRAELVAREFEQNLGSDVAGLLLTVIGVDALDHSSGIDLLTKVRGELSPEAIAGQETLGSLRTEAALVDAFGIEAGPTIARALEVAKILGIRYRGTPLGMQIHEGADTSADRHIHSLLEIAWTLTNAADGWLSAFADLTASLIACWPEARAIVAELMSALANVLPTADLMTLQPYLERIRRL